MKREVIVAGSPAQIRVEGAHFEYQRAAAVSSGSFSVTPADPGSYLVRLGTRSHRVTLGPAGEVSVNGRSLRMEVFDPRDLRPGGQSRAYRGPLRISAPMPGKVVRLLVAPGDAVQAGQGLVVVEAMKMQNEMKSPQAGRVVEVRTEAGATVAAGDVLVVVE